MSKQEKTAASDKYNLITEQICELLEKDLKPWQKPWKGGHNDVPFQNLTTHHIYKGSNPLWCAISNMYHGYNSPYFVTFLQAKQQGWQVKKGAKSAWIKFAGTVTKEEKNDLGEITEERIRFSKFSSIFSLDCIDDSDADKKITDFLAESVDNRPDNPDQKIITIDDFIRNTGAVINYGGNQAYYSPSRDEIQLPEFINFSSAEKYYATTVHELSHWTGHKNRLDREGIRSGTFGNELYAFEELIAELSSAFVSDRIFPEYMEQDLEHHANYLRSWLKILKHDNKAFFRAVSMAQKSADYLLELSGENSIQLVPQPVS